MRLLLFALLTLAASAAAAQADLDVAWEPGPEWLAPVDVNRRFFDGAIDYGTNFVFSSLPGREIPPVQIVFSESMRSVGRAFDFRDGLRDLGEARFRGAAYDVSDPAQPRRLNVGFIEDRRQSTFDAVWNPDGSASGGYEYLFVFDSDYVASAPQYAGETLYGLDVAYGLALRLANGRALYESRLELALTPPPLRDVIATAVENGTVDLSWVAADYVSAPTVEVRDGATVLASAPASDGGLTLDGLDPDRTYALTVERVGHGTRTVQVRPRVSLGVAQASSLDPGRAGGSTYGDVWGYTAPDGTEYALLAGRGGGVSVLDITAAPQAPPVEVAFVPLAAGGLDAKDVKVYGHHAYVVHEVGPIQILDLTNPAAPVEVGLLDVQPGVAQGGSHNVLVARDHLWVTGGRTSGNAGLRVYSLADPAAPVLVGGFRPEHQAVPYYHDFEVRGNRGYGPAIYSGGGVDVLDVSDPADVQLITTFTYPGAGAHNTCTSEDGNTVYVGDEIGTQGQWTRIFDVSDVQDPELVGEIVVDGQASVHNCYVRDGRLYIAHYTEGLRVFDLADPHAPVEVAFLDTYRQPGYGYAGAWTAYPYFESGKVVVSDMQTGLWVTTLGAMSTPTEPEPAASSGLRVWPNPARSHSTVAFDLVAPARVRLALVDALGREVVVVDEREAAAGPLRQRVETAGLPAGVYLVRLTVDGVGRAGVPVTVVR